ncbi:hypothetical protein AVEN_197742-1 [Araneus ventricosus]|uniref:ribonuclease H n=1 Tax=Araneus ventricosus TaxID=182803 RepID=A0A4Y2CLY3_ARAVE|nr:hypothetical protein AVEN_197742-1 [Araneus ventricosus]
MTLIAITKCYTTVSNEALQVLSGCAPLDLKIELEIEFAKQIKIIKKEEIYEGFQNFDCEELMKPWDTISIGWIYFESSGADHEIYTDGSKISNQAGASYVHYYSGTETDSCLIRLGNQNTVFMAEVMAISRAIDYCIDKNIRNSKVITDSRSTLMAIESNEEKRRIIIEIKKKLKLTKIQLQWVRAHNGTVGNEGADALAKLAASKEQIDTEFGPSKAQVSVMKGPFIEEFYQCVTYAFYTAQWQEQLYTTLTLIFMFLLPLLVLITTYTATFVTIASK